MVPSSVSGSQSSTPSPLSGPPSPQYALHHQPNRTIPNHDTPYYICLSWASHHSMHYIISPPLGSPHPLGQTILCFLGFPQWIIIVVVCIITVCIIIVCIIMVEEYLRCASGWSSFPEDARANHLPLNYVHSISPTPHTATQSISPTPHAAHSISPTLHTCTVHTPYHPHCTVHITHCVS